MYMYDSGFAPDFNRVSIFQTIQKQIDLLKFSAWPSQGVIETLNKLHQRLKVQAAWDSFRREHSGLVGNAAFHRCCFMLCLYLPDAICILESDPTLRRINGWDGGWVDTYAIEDQAIFILEQALRAASPSRYFA